MSARVVREEDLQAALQFFASQAASHLGRFGSLPPACILVWLKADQAALESLHQFPAHEVVELMRSDTGKHKLASAIREMLAGSGETPALKPHLVVQVLLTALNAGEALLLLAHTPQTTYVIALPVGPDGGVDVPATFDLAEAGRDIADD